MRLRLLTKIKMAEKEGFEPSRPVFASLHP